MPIKQTPLGRGSITWLGVNLHKNGFSEARSSVIITEDGIQEDIYCGMWRQVSGHDVDYIETDGIKRGDWALNLRQITIVDGDEIDAASHQAGALISAGMLRENIILNFIPAVFSRPFSQLPPMSRMVIHGQEGQKTLFFSEENGPCNTTSRPIAVHLSDTSLADPIKEALKRRRGQMAMVRSQEPVAVTIGDTFTIYPPMGY